MTTLTLLCILAVVVWVGLTITLRISNREKARTGDLVLVDSITTKARIIATFQKVALLSSIILLSALAFKLYHDNTAYMEPHILEWINLVVRWTHVVFGIAWIGASFYFIFLENSLNRTEGLKDDIAGNLWALHGGGFYYIEKYKVAPEKIPQHLHWFKYESYFTWLTGFLLLFIVYYFNASSFLIDKEVLDIEPNTGVAIGIGSLVVSWIFYDVLCKSPLVNKNFLFLVIMFLFTAGAAYVLCNVFSARAAYIHVGALLGTIMAANVFFVIIPSQKALVQAAKDGTELDLTLGQKAGLRSLHNNYFTLPVVFVMISSHYPSTYGSEWNWAVLAGLSAVSIGVKHFWNIYEQGELYNRWLLPAAVIGLIALALVTAPSNPATRLKDAPAVSFQEVQAIINERCTNCHSATPTDKVWATAPNGIMFDTPEQIVNMTDRILNRAVITRTMPQANQTGMKQEERDAIEIWIYQGAKIK